MREWSVELLAELHAGGLDESAEAELRPRVPQDPAADEVLAALEATRSELGALPALAVPADVLDRITAALDAEVRTAGADRADQQGGPDGPARTGRSQG
jgi:hypothetical protein